MNEHAQFKIDTSGFVRIDPEGNTYAFENLSPFQQGAVEAALRELNARLFKSDGYTEADFFGFRHLSASALQRIMADCERRLFDFSAKGIDAAGDHARGEAFWRAVSARHLVLSGYPPAHLSLAEDGLIHLSEVGE